MPGPTPSKLQRGSTLTRAANSFRIWREGAAVKWDCTFVELAQATGLTVKTVRKICKANGWTPLGVGDEEILAVDQMFTKPPPGRVTAAEVSPFRRWRHMPSANWKPGLRDPNDWLFEKGTLPPSNGGPP